MWGESFGFLQRLKPKNISKTLAATKNKRVETIA